MESIFPAQRDLHRQTRRDLCCGLRVQPQEPSWWVETRHANRECQGWYCDRLYSGPPAESAGNQRRRRRRRRLQGGDLWSGGRSEGLEEIRRELIAACDIVPRRLRVPSARAAL